MNSIVLGIGFLLCVAGGAAAEVNSSDLKWGSAPPTFAKGLEMAVLSGDPSKSGEFVVPAGYEFAAHRGVALAPGGFAKVDANMNPIVGRRTEERSRLTPRVRS